MKRHVWINREKIESVHDSDVDGVEFEVSLSPFNTPTEIVGEFSDDSGCFVITFKYLNLEPPGKRDNAGPISLVSGKHTGRLQVISIPLTSPELESVGIIELKTRIREATEFGETPRNHLNRQFARRALEDDNVNQLFEELAGAH
ncbi:MAG: hypothetical protein ACI8P0_001311 [Planctomycetaceae bacterium]|jgi:hypothetical protein